MAKEDNGIELQGETAELALAAGASGDTDSVLVILTTIFLILASLLIVNQLYTTYGVWSTETRSGSK